MEREHVTGDFSGRIPCPDCGQAMRGDYDPNGLPAASCVNPQCNQTHFGDGWLRDRGHWTETSE